MVLFLVQFFIVYVSVQILVFTVRLCFYRPLCIILSLQFLITSIVCLVNVSRFTLSNCLLINLMDFVLAKDYTHTNCSTSKLCH